jgi:hypothetical protein
MYILFHVLLDAMQILSGTFYDITNNEIFQVGKNIVLPVCLIHTHIQGVPGACGDSFIFS